MPDGDPLIMQLIWPIAARGRARRRPVPDILSIAAEDMLADAKWQNVSWRNGTKGRLKARFAAVRVRTADGPPQRIWDKGQQHLPGDEAWLIGEHRTSGENKYYLANLPAGGQPANRGGPAHIIVAEFLNGLHYRKQVERSIGFQPHLAGGGPVYLRVTTACIVYAR